MTDFETSAAVTMTGRSSCILELQIVQVGLNVRDINLAVALAHYLRTRYNLRGLHWMVCRVLVARHFSLCLGSSLHHLTNLMSGIGSFNSLEVRLLSLSQREVRN